MGALISKPQPEHDNDKLKEDLQQKEEALRRSHKEKEELRQELEKVRAEDARTRQRRAEHNTSQEVAELREQLRQYNAFYQDESARPPLLQAAADAVKDATAICATDLFTQTKQLSLPINLAAYFRRDYHMMAAPAARGNRESKIALQAFLCNLIFQDFEALDSFIPHKTSRPFERPELLRKQRLQAYYSFRYVEPADIMRGAVAQHADSIEEQCSMEFKHFFESKLSCFAKQLENILVMSKEDSEKNVQDIMKDCTKPFYISFLRLAAAVWLLHKLAFAFEPASAQIFRVAQGSPFVAEYMESMVQREDEEQSKDSDSEELVGFMNVPGFTVRNSIIKSRVFLASLFK